MGCGASAKRPAAVAPTEQPVRKPADTTQASGPENDSVVSDTLPESAPPAALSAEGGEQDWAQATMHIEEEPPTAFESGAKDIVSVSDFKTGQPMDAWSLETLSQPEYLQMARSIASQRTKLWEQLLHKHAAGSGIFACLQKPHGSFQIDDWVGDQASISYAPGMDLFFAVVPPAPLCCIPCGSFGCPFGVQPAVVDLFLTVNGQPQQQQHLCQDGRPASRGGEEAAQKLGGAGAGAFASLILDSCGPETWGLLVPLVCTSIQEATGDVPEAPHWRYGLSCCLAASALLDSLGAGSHTLHFEAHFRGPAGKDVCFVPKDGGKPYSGQLLSHDGSSDLVAQLPSSGFHSATAVASATFTINLPAEAAGTLAASLCMEVELDKASEP